MLLLRGATLSYANLKGADLFQYMLLLRGATYHAEIVNVVVGFQYMLLLRGATTVRFPQAELEPVSIHAPLARSNHQNKYASHYLQVSIHAPLARSN